MSRHLPCRAIAPTRRVPSLVEEVEAGLFAQPMSLPPKFFYDDVGSALFDAICDTPEYYPTRSEAVLLGRCAGDVMARVRPATVLELGSGSAVKTHYLLDAGAALDQGPRYVPVDVCEDVLIQSGRRLLADYGWLRVEPVVGDYMAGLGNLHPGDGVCLWVFLGGTIGNFTEHEAIEFLSDLRATMGRGDALLLGADRVKDPRRLHEAYNDAAGITARFNLNILDVLNRELGADFDPDAFSHYAAYNPVATQIEMYLIARRAQRVRFPPLPRHLVLREGAAIRTEISRKFTAPAIEALLRDAGFGVEAHYGADAPEFSLVLARPERAPGYPRIVK